MIALYMFMCFFFYISAFPFLYKLDLLVVMDNDKVALKWMKRQISNLTGWRHEMETLFILLPFMFST